MKKQKFLFLIPDVPYPERKNGLTIRYFPILKKLSKLYDLDCVLTLSSEPDKNSLDSISKLFKNIIIIKDKNKRISYAKRLRLLLSILNPKSIPHARYDYYAKEKAIKIADLYRSNNYTKLIVVTTYASHALQYLFKMGVDKNDVIVDIIDSSALHYSRQKEKNSIIHSFRLYKLLNWEYSIIRNCSQVMYISPKDCNFVAKGLCDTSSLNVVPNGVFIDGYHSSSMSVKTIPSIGFLGNMSYHPNIRGAMFTYDIYKEYKKKFGSLNYYIIGRNPIKEIQFLSNDPDVIVTGEVNDIWEYINAVDIFVIHLFTGSGQQNKVLEVMYASKPVIANAISNAGIGAVHNEHLLISETKEKCLEQLHYLIQDKEQSERLGQNAHLFIENEYSWDTIFNIYLNVLRK